MSIRQRLLRRILILGLAAYLLVSVAGGVTLAELQLHPWRRALSHNEQAVEFVRSRYGTELGNVDIVAKDGMVLKAWYARPRKANGGDVLMLHGVADNREGGAGFAAPFLNHGYGVLLPDSRAHGESGGALATYGLRESDDVHRWVEWLYTSRKSKCVYGFGESMGAALVLDSLTAEDRFCAVVAESPFSSFRSVAYERAAWYVRAPTWIGRTLLRLPVEVGMDYAKLRYGLDFDTDSPAEAVAHSATPVLLIHGTDDINILPRHSETDVRLMLDAEGQRSPKCSGAKCLRGSTTIRKPFRREERTRRSRRLKQEVTKNENPSSWPGGFNFVTFVFALFVLALRSGIVWVYLVIPIFRVIS